MLFFIQILHKTPGSVADDEVQLFMTSSSSAVCLKCYILGLTKSRLSIWVVGTTMSRVKLREV